MSIPESFYVSVTSGVGGGATVAGRSLSTRIFTQNILAPAGGQVLEFTDANAVGSYFGTSSEEYKRAVYYFGWISKNITAPRLISFMRWTQVAVAPYIIGGTAGTLLEFQAITNGSITITIGADTAALTGLDFSVAANFNDVATILQDALRTQVGLMWTSATVAYLSAVNEFVITGGDTSTTAAISVSVPSVGFDISTVFNFYNTLLHPRGAIWSYGQGEQTPADVFLQTVTASTNFGSYLYLPVLSSANMVAVATLSAAQKDLYMLLMPVSFANAPSYSALVLNIAGVALTISPLAAEYPEIFPGMIEAATNYEAPNSTQNYMYQQSALTPSVKTGADAIALDAIGVNYYGETQSNGQKISFYQRGRLSGAGVSTNITDMNTFANEAWLQSASKQAFMSVFLSLSKVSANKYGRGQALATIQSVVDLALNNGTISVGGEINSTQKLFITQITDDPQAWQQVQNLGYWLNVVIVPYTVGPVTEYKAVYTLIYKKDDIVRKIEGTHVLI